MSQESNVETDAENDNSPIWWAKELVIPVAAIVLFAFTCVGCSFDSSVPNAESIIRENMKNPDSYQRRDASVVWKGTTANGDPAFGVKLDYSGQNAFGGTVRKCEYVFFSKKDGILSWHPQSGRESCEAVSMFGNTNEMIEFLVKMNFDPK